MTNKNNNTKHPNEYNEQEVSHFLHSLGLDSKVTIFQENAVDCGSILVTLTEQDLKEELHFTNLQARRFLVGLEKATTAAATASTATSSSTSTTSSSTTSRSGGSGSGSTARDTVSPNDQDLSFDEQAEQVRLYSTRHLVGYRIQLNKRYEMGQRHHLFALYCRY